jgi:hypothetical protein
MDTVLRSALVNVIEEMTHLRVDDKFLALGVGVRSLGIGILVNSSRTDSTQQSGVLCMFSWHLYHLEVKVYPSS